MPPRELKLFPHPNPGWIQSLTWLNSAHYDTVVDDACRATVKGRFLFHLIPGVINTRARMEWNRLLLVVAQNKGSDTRRVKNVGGGIHPLTKAGKPSLYPRPRKLKALRWAKEGIFGFEGVGRGCGPCAFNRKRPDEYGQLVTLCESISALAHEYEPELWDWQWDLTQLHRKLTIGIWSQGVSNFCFPMTAHADTGNQPRSFSASLVEGFFEGGPLIFPNYRVGVFLKPGDLLLFNGRELHGVGPFVGTRSSAVLYLKKDILRCP